MNHAQWEQYFREVTIPTIRWGKMEECWLGTRAKRGTYVLPHYAPGAVRGITFTLGRNRTVVWLEDQPDGCRSKLSSLDEVYERDHCPETGEGPRWRYGGHHASYEAWPKCVVDAILSRLEQSGHDHSS